MLYMLERKENLEQLRAGLKRPADVFGEIQINEEHEEIQKDKTGFLLKRIKTFNLNGYGKISDFKRTNRKLRRFSS